MQKDKKKILMQLEKRTEFWREYDQVGKIILENLSKKMISANAALKNAALDALKKDDPTSITQTISEILSNGIDSTDDTVLEELVSTLDEEDIGDDQINALLGFIRYNTLLEKRLADISEITLSLNQFSEVKGTDAMREKLKEFGPDLAHIWKEVENSCRNTSEREMLYAAVYRKKYQRNPA